MKCAVYKEINVLEITEKDIPKPKDNEVLIKVDSCGLCATDLKIISGDFPLVSPPAILGHEYSGIVVQIGKLVSNINEGNRVAGGPVTGCGKCEYCNNGCENLCSNPLRSSGGFAEYTTAPERGIYLIDDKISFEWAACLEPVACCVYAVDLASIKTGSSIIIIGAGAMGLLLGQIAKMAGANQVIISDPDQNRLDRALELFADFTVNPEKENLKETVADITKGNGCNAVFEAVGIEKTIKECIHLVKPGGKIIIFGCSTPEAEVIIKPWEFYLKEANFIIVNGANMTFARAMKLLPTLNLDQIITHRIPLNKIKDAFKLKKAKEALKIIIKP